MALGDYGRSLFANIILAARNDALPLSLATTYILLAIAALATVGIYGVPTGGMVSLLSTFAAAIIFISGTLFLRALFAERPDRPIGFAKDYFGRAAAPERVARNLPLIIAVCLFLPVFSAFKGSISLFADYRWDDFWIAADRMLHGGDAWQLFHPLVGYPFVTFLLSLLYIVWLPLLLASVVFFAAFCRDPALRRQFLLTFFSCWALLGSVGAVLFASVGPCFVEPILGRTDFAPLMAYLESADRQWPIYVIHVQDLLARQLAENSRELGAGITAMPSMHVSIAFLYWLAARRLNRWLGWVMFTYFLIIQIGSVHLAYHYALDGYVSALLTLLIWIGCGRLVRWNQKQTDPQK